MAQLSTKSPPSQMPWWVTVTVCVVCCKLPCGPIEYQRWYQVITVQNAVVGLPERVFHPSSNFTKHYSLPILVHHMTVARPSPFALCPLPFALRSLAFDRQLSVRPSPSTFHLRSSTVDPFFKKVPSRALSALFNVPTLTAYHDGADYMYLGNDDLLLESGAYVGALS